MTKKIWSCDVVLWYATKEEPEKRLRMKFENVPGNIPNECYNKAIVLLNEKVKEATVLGGCATFNFEEWPHRAKQPACTAQPKSAHRAEPNE